MNAVLYVGTIALNVLTYLAFSKHSNGLVYSCFILAMSLLFCAQFCDQKKSIPLGYVRALFQGISLFLIFAGWVACWVEPSRELALIAIVSNLALSIISGLVALIRWM